MARYNKKEMLRLLTPHLNGFVDRGRWISFCCPYHDDHEPSFGIDTKEGGFNCFTCGETGTFGDLLFYLGIESDFEEVDAMSEGEWKDVVESLDSRVGKKLRWPGEDIKVRSPYEERAPQKYAKYLEDERFLPTHAVVRFEMGWNPKEQDRILIPVRSLKGDQVIWIERRRIDGGKPKYWRPKGTKKEFALYGYSDIRRHNWVVVTEGIFDAIALGARGLPTVCCFGGFSDFQRNALIKRFDVLFICFDGDSAGRQKSREARKSLKHCGVLVRNVKLPEGKDPADCSDRIASELMDIM